MKFREMVIIIFLYFLTFWIAPSYLVGFTINIKTHQAEQFLNGERCIWFKHHGIIYTCGAITHTQQHFVSCNKVTDEQFCQDAIDRGWVQDIKELR